MSSEKPNPAALLPQRGSGPERSRRSWTVPSESRTIHPAVRVLSGTDMPRCGLPLLSLASRPPRPADIPAYRSRASPVTAPASEEGPSALPPTGRGIRSRQGTCRTGVAALGPAPRQPPSTGRLKPSRDPVLYALRSYRRPPPALRPSPLVSESSPPPRLVTPGPGFFTPPPRE
jgi:hypothetical protein